MGLARGISGACLSPEGNLFLDVKLFCIYIYIVIILDVVCT